MGFIRALINLIILIIIVVFGYWLYATYVSAPDAPYWAQINGYMPDALRRYSCEQVRKRAGTGPITSCEGY
jgi:hypothetical protein